MQKIQVQTEINIDNIISQLTINELKTFHQKVSMAISQHNMINGEYKETELLQQLQEITLPEEELHQFEILLEKRDQKELTKQEQDRLLELIKQEEVLRHERIKILGELSQIRSISLQDLMNQLGMMNNV